ncbi:DNA cytosine methyltransferase [Ochrobactrum teleogrylli]|uniref:DNA cytosine methyltransferase n=1 Tax=Ochrobactrum teleogrylli TaxID=2479765 RepID=A0ABY2Y0N4_9HYPH|nr:DNA cytosine methyltransferase [[Ochrobactrum] teleogrylli]TNV09119.1 DNA cytosine methyltransferase [[Ochrobactrum] teleogrylli]
MIGRIHRDGGPAAELIGAASELDFVVITKNPQALVGPQLSGILNVRQAMPVGLSSEHNFVVATKDEGNENPPEWTVRRFTPLECERLQGFPDYWTDVPFRGKLPLDSIRYEAIGNSMPCTFMSWLGMQLSFMDELEWMMAQSSFLNRSRGRPPKNGVAMTNAERQRLHRQKKKAETRKQCVAEQHKSSYTSPLPISKISLESDLHFPETPKTVNRHHNIAVNHIPKNV